MANNEPKRPRENVREERKLDHDLLLREYEICNSSARSIEAPIWQIGAVLGFGSIGAIALLASNNNRIAIEAVAAIGALFSILSYIWYKMASRLWSIQHTEYLRMLHIELKLGSIMRQQYIRRRDRVKEHNHNSKKWPSLKNIPKGQLAEIDSVNGFAIYGTRYYSGMIVIITWISWAIYVVFKSKFLQAFSIKIHIDLDRFIPSAIYILLLALLLLSDIIARQIIHLHQNRLDKALKNGKQRASR